MRKMTSTCSANKFYISVVVTEIQIETNLSYGMSNIFSRAFYRHRFVWKSSCGWILFPCHRRKQRKHSFMLDICNFDCFVIYYDWIHFVKLNCILMWENRFCVDRNWSAWRKMTSIFQHTFGQSTRTLQDIRPNFLFTRNHKMHR